MKIHTHDFDLESINMELLHLFKRQIASVLFEKFITFLGS